MNNVKGLRRFAYWSAVVLSLFNALSAVAGGLGILLTGGLGMPASILANGPFDTFTIPGVILLVAVGGTQAISAWLLIVRAESALFWTAVAGAGMVIWIFVETGVIAGISWLQIVYFITGIVQIIAVEALLGVVTRLPRRPLRDHPNS